MNRKAFWLAVAMAALSHSASAAGCDDIDELLKSAYPEATADGEALVLPGGQPRRIETEKVACKIWPYKTELTLLAVPLTRSEADDMTYGDVEVLVLDSATGLALARRVERGMADSDAINFDGIALDTARYDISPTERAFGLLTAQSGSSRVNPYTNRALWLYRFDGKSIDRVLDGLVVESIAGENDGNCTGAVVRIERKVSVLPEVTNGYTNLGIEETSVGSASRETNGECVSEDSPAEKVERRLTFSDGRYRSETEVSGLFSFIEIRPAD